MRIPMILAMFMAALPAWAEVADTKSARQALYPVRGYEVRLSEGLSGEEAATVKAIVPLMAEQLRQPVRYYGAIAFSPRDGMVHESLQAAMNYHAPDAAAAAAVRACMGLRSAGAEPCKVAALLLPKGWVPRDVMLSVDATAVFDKSFRRASGPKAFAVSRETGAFGAGTSDAAALTACGAPDCAVVIRDPR